MTTVDHSPRHLFDCWNEISHRIEESSTIRLFLDFDGTLAKYRSRPTGVRLAATTRRVLQKLARRPNVCIAIVSGRRSQVLQRYFRIPGIDFLGLYGAENNGALVVARETLRAVPALAVKLALLPAAHPGVYIEEKGISFAIHFRGAAPEIRKSVQQWLKRLAPRIRGNFRIIRSYTAWEIVPREVRGKGAAVRALMKKRDRSLLPIYVGDDLTDEPAFRVLQRGITVCVGERARTSAQYRLRNPDQVREFLERLEEELP